MAKSERAYFTIPEAVLESMAARDLMDMLRYDAAVVENNAPAGFYLLSAPHGPTVGRWRSFGVTEITAWDRDLWRPSDEPVLARR